MAYAPNIARIEDDGSETPMTLSSKSCEWKRDGDGGYYVKCGDFRVKTPRCYVIMPNYAKRHSLFRVDPAKLAEMEMQRGGLKSCQSIFCF